MRRRSISTTRFASVVVFVAMGLFNSIEQTLAQTTEFTYQGNLTNAGSPADGNFDFDFRLFDAPTGGAQIPSFELVRSNVSVVNGLFTVSLDFGNSFSGTDRWLEIRVRTAGGGGFTILDPRQKIGSTPYSIRSLNSANATNADTAQNALQLGGVAANQYVVTTDPRMSDDRAPTAGSSNYIQNQNAGAQAASNFNISGDGTVGGTLSGNIVDAAAQYNINGSRVLSVGGTGNVFAGFGAGGSNTSGAFNSFFGRDVGFSNTTGSSNAFFGADVARFSTGAGNAFFGAHAGQANTTGDSNAFFGRGAGFDNTTGVSNAFFGFESGISNTTGSNNTAIGNGANVNSDNLSFATAIGSEAVASTSNSVYLGRADGSDTVRVPGDIVVSGISSLNGNLAVASGASAAFTGAIFIQNLAGGGVTTLCRNAQTGQVLLCSSSARYKTDITGYSSGLDLLNRLRPVSFSWRDGGRLDLGLIAEDVAAIEPLLATYNEKGEIEGVKYDRIGVVLVNAVKEQQKQLERQEALITAMRGIICRANPAEAICAEPEEKKNDEIPGHIMDASSQSSAF